MIREIYIVTQVVCPEGHKMYYGYMTENKRTDKC